jgi:transposase-like protein
MLGSRYDASTKAKAIRLVRKHAGDYPTQWAAITAVSGRLGISAETLRKWIRQAEVDGEDQAKGKGGIGQAGRTLQEGVTSSSRYGPAARWIKPASSMIKWEEFGDQEFTGSIPVSPTQLWRVAAPGPLRTVRATRRDARLMQAARARSLAVPDPAC